MSDTTQKQEDAEQEAPKKGFFSRLFTAPKKICHTGWEFWKELWRDHQFWVNALAVKGGAAAILAGAAVGISFAFTFPFLVTAGIVLLCSGAIALGTVGIIAGSSKIWEKLKDTWYKATGKERPPEPIEHKKTFLEKLNEKPLVKKIVAHRWSQNFFTSRTWQTVKKMKEKQDGLLGGLAVGGSLAYTVVGVWLLAAQIVALPVIAIPTILTVAVIGAASYIASGIAGIWISTRNIVRKRSERRGEQKKLKSKQASVDGVPDLTLQEVTLPEMPLIKAFEAANNGDKAPVNKTLQVKSTVPKAELKEKYFD